jgi:hypothetical protein
VRWVNTTSCAPKEFWFAAARFVGVRVRSRIGSAPMASDVEGEAGGGVPALDEAELRKALQDVFDKFDSDGSGTVSTSELIAMAQELQLDASAEQLAEMMADSDLDRSGEIDFEEFVAVVKAQVTAGHAGGLAGVISQASGVLDFFNRISSVFSWQSQGGPSHYTSDGRRIYKAGDPQLRLFSPTDAEVSAGQELSGKLNPYAAMVATMKEMGARWRTLPLPPATA